MQLIGRFWLWIKNFCKRNEKILVGAMFGSLLTILIGMFVNYKIQQDITERAQKFEIHKLESNRREKIFVEVFDLVEERMFRLDRFVWAYPVKSVSYKKLNKYWKGYVDSLRTWDIEYRKYKAQLEIYYPPPLAKEFSKVQGLFETARSEVRTFWRKCAINQCDQKDKEKTLFTGDKRDIGNQKRQKIDRCVREKRIIEKKHTKKYTIRSYIRCVVADAREGVGRFSIELIKAHKRAQKEGIPEA